MEEKKEVDGNSVVNYMQDASSKAQQIGRQVIYALIAIIWANIFHKGKIDPSIWLVLSLICGIVYTCLDYLYYFVSALFYKKILMDYFYPEENVGMVYKEGVNHDDVDCKTKQWFNKGVWCIFILMILLVLTASFLIVYIIESIQ